MDLSKRNRFGLIGRNISYSFSKGYFDDKFNRLGLSECSYENFDIQNIEMFIDSVVDEEFLAGLNVTIPYKQDIIPFLDEIDAEAAIIGAVNTIKITSKGTKGFNTDAYGFKKALSPYLKLHHKRALILGTGGASKAILHVLNELGIEATFVSRNPKQGVLTYSDIDESTINSNTLIVNCSPVGTFPQVEEKPAIPYEFLGENHLLFDLIYNPEKTSFLKHGEERGASICNGYQMLVHQAEKAWEIWNS